VGKSPEVLKREHASFKKRFLGSTKQGNPLTPLANSKEELERQIQDALGGTPPRPPASVDAARELEGAVKVQGAYEEERQAGGKMVGSVIQRYLNQFAQFVGAYGNLLEAVATAGGPYGEVGFQTLSILFIVSLHTKALH
jgi:hypothetical protein